MLNIRDGLSWRWKRYSNYVFLIRSFRNGIPLAVAWGRGRPCNKIVCWSGSEISHPVDQSGLLETVIEVWHEKVYTGSFYAPKSGDVIIDAGANIGLFSILVSRLRADCQVYAFEPFEENFQCCSSNLKSNAAENVKLYKAAVGGISGVGKMQPVGVRSLDHRLSTSHSADGNDVSVFNIEDLIRLSNAERIAFFKMDIEGSEYEAFESASSTNLEKVDRFAIEHHEHLRPGVKKLITQKLEPTHNVIISDSNHDYGMIYAVRK